MLPVLGDHLLSWDWSIKPKDGTRFGGLPQKVKPLLKTAFLNKEYGIGYRNKKVKLA